VKEIAEINKKHCLRKLESRMAECRLNKTPVSCIKIGDIFAELVR